MADETSKIAEELYQLLVSIRYDEKRQRCRSLLEALKTVWKGGKIETTKNRLEWIRNELQFRIIVDIKIGRAHV